MYTESQMIRLCSTRNKENCLIIEKERRQETPMNGDDHLDNECLFEAQSKSRVKI